MRPERVGKVVHYFSRLGVAVLSLQRSLWRGDRIRIAGHTTDLEQPVTSMEIDHRAVDYAVPGDRLAIKVGGKVRPGDTVYLEAARESTAEPELAAAL